MSDTFDHLPARVTPYVILGELNQPVPVVPGPFRLVGATEGSLDADLTFRWVPSTAVAFEGSYSHPYLDLDAQSWFLQSDNPQSFEVAVLMTHVTPGMESSHVRGVVHKDFSLGESPFEVLRFSLANFPDYIGAPVQYEHNGRRGFMAARLQTSAGNGLCRVDEIPEARELRKCARRDAGFVISHVGEWLLSPGQMNVTEAKATLEMLHFWFGLLRGAWSGPLFPEGLVDGKVIWRHFAPWKLEESREVTTWMPRRKPLDLSALFSGFVQRWSDPAWRGPLKSSISWFVEANSSRTALESKIVLSQVALELLAWVHVVETQGLHRRADFKDLFAADRIRALLLHIGVPATVPDYLTHLLSLQRGKASDGPGVITWVRNALVHATEEKRAVIGSLDGSHLLECSQLALQYVELAILAVCGHSGYYARRGWTGWKGDDEVVVPWGRTPGDMGNT